MSSGKSNRGRGAPRQPYVHPIPSREEIVAAFQAADIPLRLKDVGKHLGINTQGPLQGLDRRLRAMVRDGRLIRNRAKEYCLLERVALVTGRVSAHRDGYGFLLPDDGSDDLYLSSRQMRQLFDGDLIAARVSGEDHRGRREGQLVEVLQRAVTELVGRFARERGIELVIPDNPRLGTSILVPRAATGGAKPGQFVRVEVTEYPTPRTDAIGRVVAVLGDDHTPGIEITAALLSHGIPHQWPTPVVEQAEKFGVSVPTRAKQDREDLRSLPLITIDGADARDFDDAVFCRPMDSGGWELIVAIADVSHYVTVDSALDVEAKARGTSVYFPGRVVPMLPEALSNGLCSLNPKVDRLCLACEMRVSANGKVSRSRFFNGVMRSHDRLTYSESQKLLDGRRGRRKTEPVVDVLQALRDVHGAFAAARRRRGAIDFDLPVVKFKCDDRGHIESIVAQSRMLTHRIIEECMIAANVEAARFLRKAKLPALYRVHETPDEDKLKELKLFLSSFGARLGGGQRITAKNFNQMLASFAGRPEEELIETVVLRSMQQARYKPNNIGHFGLALTAYAHFTSPIRRYPDLLVHRAIKCMLRHGSPKGYPYSMSTMTALGESSSRSERRAEEAVWDVEEKLKCEYMSHHIGESYQGIVSGVVAFGLFVRVPELGIDGLVHVSNLPDDYYHFDAANYSLTGEHYGRRYRLADPIDVRVLAVDLDEAKIDFQLAAMEQGQRPREKRRGGRRRR